MIVWDYFRHGFVAKAVKACTWLKKRSNEAWQAEKGRDGHVLEENKKVKDEEIDIKEAVLIVRLFLADD